MSNPDGQWEDIDKHGGGLKLAGRRGHGSGRSQVTVGTGSGQILSFSFFGKGWLQ